MVSSEDENIEELYEKQQIKLKESAEKAKREELLAADKKKKKKRSRFSRIFKSFC